MCPTARIEAAIVCAIVNWLWLVPSFAVAQGEVAFHVVGPSSDKLPCRIHLTNSAGKPQRVDGLPYWRNHFVCDGSARFQLPVGEYKYEIERGPEWSRAVGEFSIEAGRLAAIAVALKRVANLPQRGWWCGDLHIHRKVEEIELLMRAEDLHIGPVITWWNNRNLWKGRTLPDRLLKRFDETRFLHVMAGEDEREGGALLYFNLNQPLEIAGSTREYPSPMRFVADARRHEGVWIDIEKPFWWDVPVWLASGQVNSIGLANNHMCRSRMYESEAWGRPRDTKRLPAPRGNGFWTQEIYYHILNCGLRIPPSAGSASGVLPNPVGYNRVFVHIGEKLDYDAWWRGLRAGRSFVTNGPLLVCQVNGQLPGRVFVAEDAKFKALAKIELASNDPVLAIEIIYNGKVAKSIPCDAKARKQTLTTTLEVTEPGWLLVRAIADVRHTFRFASTAPYYVEFRSKKHRVSRQSAQFFVDWVRERMRRVKLSDDGQRKEVLRFHDEALVFWQAKLRDANAD
jgi:hypothetical protein